MTFSDFHILCDAWFIAPFRWVAPAEAGFLFGVLVLAVQSFLAALFSLYVVSKVQHRLRLRYDTEIALRQDLSFAAIAAKDKPAYLAQNHLAQEAYGRSSALAVGRFCAGLWPAVMALAWLDTRFNGLSFPLPLGFLETPVSLSCAFVFLFFLVSIHLAYILLKKPMWNKVCSQKTS